MRLIIGSRHSGKSLKLIQESARQEIYIVVKNMERANELYDQARKLGYNMPFPITMRELVERRTGNRYLRERGVLVDDLDDIVEWIFDETPIRAATWTRCEAVGKSVEWLKANPHLEKPFEEEKENDNTRSL